MQTKSLLRNIIILSVVLCNIGCDQVSKKVVRNNIAPDEIISMMNSHLIVTNVENSGAFLSVGDSLSKPAKNILLSLLPFLALSFGVVYAYTKRYFSVIPLLSLCFILGGGIGNIFDRIMYGAVTDFLHIDFGILQTGIFNMADVSITTGAIMLAMHSGYKHYKSRKELQ